MGLHSILSGLRAALLAGVLMALGSGLARAQEDAGFLAGLLQSALSGSGREVTITGFEGALSSRAQIAELTISDADGIWLRLEGLELDWSRLALLRRRLEVTSLRVARIDLARPPRPALPPAQDGALASLQDLPSAAAGGGLRLPDLPVSVQIGAFNVGVLDLGPEVTGSAAQLALSGRAHLAGGAGEIELRAQRIDADMGAAQLVSGYSNETEVLRIDLSLNEPAGGLIGTALGLPGAPSIALQVQGDGPLSDFAARLDLTTDGAQRLSGTMRLQDVAQGAPQDAMPQARMFSADVGGDLTALFLPEYRGFFGADMALSVTGQRSATGAVQIDQLALASAQMTVTGAARIAASGAPQRLDLDVTIADTQGGTVRLPLPGAPIDVMRAGLAIGFDAGAGDEGWRLSGMVEGLEHPAIRLVRVDLQGSGRTVGALAGTLSSAGGTLRLAAQGLRPADPALAQALGPEITASGKVFWHAEEDGSGQTTSGQPLPGQPLPGLTIRQGQIAGNGYRGDLSARVAALAGDLDIIGQIKLAADDLGRFAALAGQPGLTGAGQISYAGTMRPIAGAFDGVLDAQGDDLGLGIPELDGLLQGPAQLGISARRDDTGIALRALSLAASSLTAQVSGQISADTTDLWGQVGVADLGVLGPGYGGAADISGTFSRGKGRDAVDLRGTATDLALATDIAELNGLLAGSATLDVQAAREGARVDITQVSVQAGPLSLSGKGVLAQDVADFSGSFSLSDLAALGRGWQGSLSAQTRINSRAGEETITVQGRADGVVLGIVQADALLAGPIKVDATARHRAGDLRLDALTVASGQVNATASGNWRNGQGALDLVAQIADLGRIVPEIPGPLRLAGRVERAGSTLDLDLAATGPAGLDMAVVGSLDPEANTGDLALRGGFDALLANVVLAPAALRGPVAVDLRLRGPLGPAAVQGTLRLDGLRATIPEPPLALEVIRGTVAFDAGQARLDLAGQPKAGGSVAITGTAALTAPYDGALQLTLDRAVFQDPQIYETVVSGTSRITGPLRGGGQIEARIILGETNLRIATTGLGGFGALPGLEHTGESRAVRTTLDRAGLGGEDTITPAGLSSPFALDLKIDAPRRIFVRGRGLDAELGGAISVGGTTAAVLPTGGFNLVRGRLELLGKRFDLTEGSATMEGRFIPRLRFVASTSTDDG